MGVTIVTFVECENLFDSRTKRPKCAVFTQLRIVYCISNVNIVQGQKLLHVPGSRNIFCAFGFFSRQSVEHDDYLIETALYLFFRAWPRAG